MKEIQDINGRTEFAAVIGSPIGHSSSPAIYNTAFQEQGLNMVYLAFETPREETVQKIKALQELGVKGINCTMPCKEEALKCVDNLSEAARYVQAANMLVPNSDGTWTGYNTDGAGLWRSVKEEGVDIKGKRTLLFGSGGTTRAILAQAPAEGITDIKVVARHLERPLEIKDVIKRIERDYPEINIELVDLYGPDLQAAVQQAEIIVQTTNVGMTATKDQSILPDENWLNPNAVCVDVIYEQPVTTFMKQAERRGCKVIGGLGMLVYQGAINYELFAGHVLPVDVVFDRLLNK